MMAFVLAQTIAITGGTVYPVSGPKIEQATVLIRDGKIAAVGTDVTIPADATRIDGTGKWVTPGFIDGAGQIGLVEINAVSGGREASIRDDTSAVDRRRRNAFVKRIGLSPRDEALLIAALKDVRKHLEDVSAGPPQAAGAAAPAVGLARLRNGVDAVFRSADQRIRAVLSQDGSRRLDQFVREQVQPHIRVYGASR